MPCLTRKRVVPSESDTNVVEIRPSRFLRIQHHNPRPRDENFSREMALFMQYKKSGIPSSGPLIMPKKVSKQDTKQVSHDIQIQQAHPLAANDSNSNSNTNESGDKKNDKAILLNGTAQNMTTDETEDFIPSMPASKSSSVLSSPAHLKDNDKIHSASSVQVAMHNMKKYSESKLNSNNMDANVISEASENENELKICLSEPRTDAIFHNHTHTSPVPLSETSDLTPFQADLYTLKRSDINKMNDTESKTAQDILPVIRPSVLDIVIFFIHGVGGSSDIWCAQIEHFAGQGYEVVAPDLIGHGFSCCPKTAGAYHFKEIAADIEEIFDRYCKKKNVVIGHSYGASFATLLARNRSRRIHKLVLISGGPPTPLAPQPGVFDLPVCMLGCIKPCLVCGFRKGAFHKKRKSVLTKSEAFNIPTYVLQHTMNGQIWADGDEIYHNWLTSPTLLIYGADDKLVTLDEELHMEEAIFSSHLVVIKDASHMVMIEAPEEVNELLSNFIQHVPDAKTSRTNENNSQLQSQQPSSSRQMPEISLRRSISRISQKSLRSAKSHRSLPKQTSHLNKK